MREYLPTLRRLGRLPLLGSLLLLAACSPGAGLGSDSVGFPLPGYKLRVVGDDGGEHGGTVRRAGS